MALSRLMRFSQIFFALSLISSAVASANSRFLTLSVSPSSLNDNSILNKVIFKTQEIFPARLKDELPWKIEVAWGDVSRFQPIQWQDCNHPSLKSKNLAIAEDVRYYFGKRIQMRKILLNPALEQGIRENKKSCRHRTALGLAQGAIIQRLARAFDQVGRETPLSLSTQYLALSGFYVWGNSHRSIYKNQNLRHHDPREWSGPSSHFAANLEHALLDPAWACHRPAVNEYFRSIFPDRAPSPCLLEVQKTLKDNQTTSETIDPSRVYQVRLQTVAPGKAFASSWGHSMLRVIVCAPERTEVGPECLNDTDHHLILSFYADTGGKPQTFWEGMNGTFDSKFYIFPYKSMATSYIQTENRPIEETILPLNETETQILLAQATELNRYYTGRWHDLTWNCATQLFTLLQSALQNDRLGPFESTTPTSLRQKVSATFW